MIISGKLFELFLETLNHSNSKILEKDDVVIENLIFDEFSIEAPAFLSKTTLDRLKDEGIIDTIIKEKSKQLQKEFLSLDSQQIWTAEMVKNNPDWYRLFSMSDEISRLVHNKWTKDEIEYLKTL